MNVTETKPCACLQISDISLPLSEDLEITVNVDGLECLRQALSTINKCAIPLTEAPITIELHRSGKLYATASIESGIIINAEDFAMKDRLMLVSEEGEEIGFCQVSTTKDIIY